MCPKSIDGPSISGATLRLFILPFDTGDAQVLTNRCRGGPGAFDSNTRERATAADLPADPRPRVFESYVASTPLRLHWPSSLRARNRYTMVVRSYKKVYCMD
ncbi:hypothetical protein BC628DRAFT_1087264 [Trametes gibbosa]|nr:hypothetical protein BC628DRAFT_1087264 [Trametes gibbosa]